MLSGVSVDRAKFVVLGVLFLALVLPVRAGAVTIQLGPSNLAPEDPFATCDSFTGCTAKTIIPTSLSEPGATLVTPADGTITSWRVHGNPPPFLHLRIVKATGNGQFTGVATSGVAKFGDGIASTGVAIGIAAGHQLGIEMRGTNPATKLFGNSSAPGASWSEYAGGLPDGATAPPTLSAAGAEPLFNATVELFRPLVLNMTSTSGPETGGDIVVINGVHLAIATSVTFGGVPAQILIAGRNQVMVSAPPHAPGPVGVVVTTAGGVNEDSPQTSYTYTAVPPAPPDTTSPVLRGLTISPISFRAKAGANLSFRSSEAASVRFRALKKPASNRGRFTPVPGSFTFAAKAGPNRLRFNARLNGKRLKVGRYRLVAVAKDAVGNRSKPLRRTFKIIR